MNLNVNSTSAKLYRWFYATEDMPQNLCPYFWKLVLLWFFILPYSILSLPVILMDSKSPERRDIGERAATGVLIWFVLGCLLSMLFFFTIFWLKFPKDSFSSCAQMTGAVCWFVGIVVGTFQGIKWLREKWQNRHIKYDEDGYRIWHPVQPKQDSIIVAFTKAKYNKYCPKIDWK